MSFPCPFIPHCAIIYTAVSCLIPSSVVTGSFKITELRVVIAYNDLDGLQNTEVKIKVLELERLLSS